MLILGPLGFTAPWLLTALAGLPLLWWLLRAVPPAPAARVFPGVTLLLGLEDRETQTDRTPWWLLLLRLLALAAIILGFAGPVLNPETGAPGRGPLLVLIDDSWAAAPDWRARRGAGARALAEAASAGRPTMLLRPSAVPTEPRLALRTAKDTAATLAGLTPVPWTSDHAALLSWLATLDQSTTFDTLWISDGLATPGRAPLARALQARGGLRVLAPPGPRFALRPARIEDGLVHVEALRLPGGPPQAVDLIGHGPDPAGVERELVRVTLTFGPGETEARAGLSLPPELRNRITRFGLADPGSAGTVTLADDTLRRRKVALVEADAGREGLELLSPLHYLREALVPTAGIIEGPLTDLLPAAPDVVVLADVARLAPDTADALATWVAEGGLLLRFAGPRLAASDTGRGTEDPLLPVRLRAGGRSVGGAMSWGRPRALAPFPDNSPFYGLAVPKDVTVSAQVLAEPGPMLAERTIAALADGTPLVTRKPLGDGQVVLFHSSANAEWSSLALSGLFVQMLERLAVSTRAGRAERGDLTGTIWQPEQLLDGFGKLEAAGEGPGVAGERLAGPPGPTLPPGLYRAEARVIAVNAVGAETVLEAAAWPPGVVPEWQGQSAERDLSGWLFLAAMALLGADILAALWLTGRLARGLAVLLLAVSLAQSPAPAGAEPATGGGSGPATGTPDPATLSAALNVTLAHVLTGDASVDEIARAGLTGLTDQLWMRSSVEASAPVGLDLETDELSAYPLIYWPVTEAQPTPSAAAYARLNAYLRAGGMILFDTRDGDVAGFGSGATAEGARLQSLARPLDIPPLEPVPGDHVLTRSFYLLSDFPGRFTGDAWVEAAPADAERAEGMPFRNLNDGVSPVVIGGNDWAGAWAVDATGRPLLPVGRGVAGERQREIAYRFGINLVMHVLTGNYKSDQVHVPALLERLGQ
ncbi:MAG: LytTR family transcriptional regulator [Rhodobacterales bacterium]|nr:MAG: LytTR family transcriptional regulator [Rhodobacterales bacterium]